jgi:hypothetical protein
MHWSDCHDHPSTLVPQTVLVMHTFSSLMPPHATRDAHEMPANVRERTHPPSHRSILQEACARKQQELVLDMYLYQLVRPSWEPFCAPSPLVCVCPCPPSTVLPESLLTPHVLCVPLPSSPGAAKQRVGSTNSTTHGQLGTGTHTHINTHRHKQLRTGTHSLSRTLHTLAQTNSQTQTHACVCVCV